PTPFRSAARRPEAARREQPRVLHVALTPPAIALRRVDERRRAFLVSALDVAREPHSPPGFAHERGLDKIVRKDAPAERLAARQLRQRAVLDERLDADDGVVAPKIPLVLLPIVEPREKQRAVEPACERLHPREQRLAVHDAWRGLDNSRRRVFL